MQIMTATGGIAATNCYLIVDETTAQCVLFDAPDHTVSKILDEIRRNNWNLIGLWFTHGHFDHVADHQVVRDAFPNVKFLIHPLDEAKLKSPGTKFFTLPFHIPPGHADALLDDGQMLSIGSLSCRVIPTPGHSPGHVGYYFAQDNVLVGGDLIIGGAIGRYDLPDANFDQLCDSIRRVMKLPPETRLLPGHGEISTLGEELASNPYVRQIVENS